MDYCKACGCVLSPLEYDYCPDHRNTKSFTNKCTIDNQVCERVTTMGIVSNLCDECKKAMKHEKKQ